MSEKDKDKADFEFIKEQVIEKKRRKLKKRLLPLLMTILLAILFGLVAAVTFVVAEPKLYKFFNKEDTKTAVDFPTLTPEEQDAANGSKTGGNDSSDSTGGSASENPSGDSTDGSAQSLIIQKIDASLEDYITMNDEILGVINEVDKSMVNVTSTFKVDDWFGASEKTINTTGVIVASNTSDYLILVSLDRVRDAESLRIKFSNTSYVDVVLQDYESELNLALLALTIEDIPEIYKNSLKVAELGESYGVTVGSPVIAVGNPNGHINSMDVGIVTSKGSYATITDNKIELFNTNMEDNENSDGVIINLDGKIVGLITRTLKDYLNEDLNTVIGISKIKPIIINMGNQKPRIYFGIKADDMSEDLKEQHSITNGIYINEVVANSPAMEAGLRDGDIILSVNDQAILNTNNFYNIITAYQAGQEVTVKIKRITGNSEKEIDIKVDLAEKVQ